MPATPQHMWKWFPTTAAILVIFIFVVFVFIILIFVHFTFFAVVGSVFWYLALQRRTTGRNEEVQITHRFQPPESPSHTPLYLRRALTSRLLFLAFARCLKPGTPKARGWWVSVTVKLTPSSLPLPRMSSLSSMEELGEAATYLIQTVHARTATQIFLKARERRNG